MIRIACSLLLVLLAAAAVAQPDLSGVYDVGTLTPLERPEAYGDRLYLTAEEAEQLERQAGNWRANANAASDPERAAPRAGGSIGGYNAFWLDRGERATAVEGRFRTSIISAPANGRKPPMTEAGAARMRAFLDDWRIVWRSRPRRRGATTGRPGGWSCRDRRPTTTSSSDPSRSAASSARARRPARRCFPTSTTTTRRIVQTPDPRRDPHRDEPRRPHRPPRRGAPAGSGFNASWLRPLDRPLGGRHPGGPDVGDSAATYHRSPEHRREPRGHAKWCLEATRRTARSSTASPSTDPTVWTEPWSGAYTWKPRPRAGSTSTPATRATTLWATSCEGPVGWRPRRRRFRRRSSAAGS